MGDRNVEVMAQSRFGSSSGWAALLAAVAVLTMVIAAWSPLVSAETGTKALVLDSSVSGGSASSEATEAVAAGFEVTVVDDATWAAMTAAQFADYQLVIVGDPTCGDVPEVVGANATNLADAVMARAGGNTVVGNRIVVGTDPDFHISAGTTGDGGRKLIETGIRFAGAQEGATGLYLTTGCSDPDYDADGEPDGVELLGLLTVATDNWTVDTLVPCGGSASLISNADQFATLTSAHLQGWNCSVHQTYPTFPTDWSPLALATDSATTPVSGTDVDTGAAVGGEAYVLIAGSGITTESPDLDLTPDTATNTVGTTHTVTATVTNPDDTPRSGVVVEFAVTGANAGATGTCAPVSCTTGATGTVDFTYTGANLGTDTINGAITVDGSRQTATATKIWEPEGSSTTTSSTLPGSSTTTSSTSTTIPGGGSDFFDETALSNGSAARLTGTITCEVGRRYRIDVTLTQGDVVGERVRMGRCTGEPVRFRVKVRADGFVNGPAQIEGTIQIGNPSTRTIEETFTVDEEVLIEVPTGLMGEVVDALLAMDELEDELEDEL